MTASRADMLEELGLGPEWRRRAFAPAAPTLSPQGEGEVAAAAPPARGPAGVGTVRRPAPTAAPATVAPATRPVARPAPSPATSSVARPVARPVASPVASPDARPATADAADADRRVRIAHLSWEELGADIAACTACGLCRTRHLTVPGVGDHDADWMFVGEAPGAEEDARGEPFVGQAGRLLDSMLGALGMNRARNVYIANVLKCRPPNNRTPEPAEAAACRPYLERQQALLRPKLIVALGRSAASLLLGTDATIASLRGRVHRYREVPLVVTYHPAYLLRTLPDKAKAWEDLLLARATVAENAGLEPADPPSVPIAPV